MNHKEYVTVHASFTLSARDLTALDMLAEAHCLRNRSDVVRYLIRRAIKNLHKTTKENPNA